MDRLLNHSDIERLRSLLDQSRKIVLTCHVRPDGDAIGSTLGLASLLNKLGKEAKVVVPDQPPRNLSFLPGFADIAVFSRYDPYCTRLVEEADLILCLDFNKPSRQDHLEGLIQGAKAPKVMIDHHQDPDDFALVTFSYPDMSSASELAFRIIAALGFYTEIDRDAATCLLTGIVTDTRNFSVNTKHPDIYEILMRLMQKGADKETIVKQALLTRSYASVRLQAYALYEKLEILEHHHAAVICLDASELQRFGYEKGDTEGLANAALEIRGVASAFFLREDADCIKVSARSIGNFPVSRVCEDLFGGGGHIQAAGAEFHGSLEECRRMIVEALPLYDSFLPKKLDKIEK